MHNVVGSPEAASILGVDRATFNRFAARGDLPVEYEGYGATGARLFKRADVEKLARDRERARRGRAGQGQTTISVEGDVEDSLLEPTA